MAALILSQPSILSSGGLATYLKYIQNEKRVIVFLIVGYDIAVDKAPRLSISIVIWILSSDTICQLNQFNTNSEAAMLST